MWKGVPRFPPVPGVGPGTRRGAGGLVRLCEIRSRAARARRQRSHGGRLAFVRLGRQRGAYVFAGAVLRRSWRPSAAAGRPAELPGHPAGPTLVLFRIYSVVVHTSPRPDSSFAGPSRGGERPASCRRVCSSTLRPFGDPAEDEAIRLPPGASPGGSTSTPQASSLGLGPCRTMEFPVGRCPLAISCREPGTANL